jgi:hypothetical protein
VLLSGRFGCGRGDRVNEAGVAIGNEAVFTKGKYGAPSLTGMDLLRLGLERAESAERAVNVIIELLETYGQGGNCGFDHTFYYDNAFLIMDRGKLFVLETCNKSWVVKSYPRASISNRLSIGSDGERYGGGVCDFAKTHSDPLYSYFPAAVSERRKAPVLCLHPNRSGYDARAAHHDGNVRTRLRRFRLKLLHALWRHGWRPHDREHGRSPRWSAPTVFLTAPRRRASRS